MENNDFVYKECVMYIYIFSITVYTYLCKLTILCVFSYYYFNINALEMGVFVLFGFNISILGKNYGFLENTILATSLNERDFKLLNGENNNTLRYVNNEFKIEVITIVSRVSNNTVKLTNEIINRSENEIIITHFSSGVIRNIADNGGWTQRGRLWFYTCKNCWQGEFQWVQQDISQLMIYNVSTHNNNSSYRIGSSGSWSTSKYYPLIIVEDTTENRCYYSEMLSSASWEIEVGNYAEELTDGYIYIENTAASENCDGWNYKLKSGESYKAVPVICGMCNGGFSDAVKELNSSKRTINRCRFENDIIPVSYNCYMNSLWSLPRANDLISIIDSASNMGVEYFCIDAGWYCGYADKRGLGSWIVDEKHFEPYGLKGIFDYIVSKNMKPGIWFEFEACCRNEKLYKEEYLLKRHGKVIGGDRAFLDFRNPEVKKYLFNIVDSMCDIGLCMIKNDYNQTVGIGIDDELCFSEALKDNTQAFLSFIDELHRKHPGLIIENCGSGAMRCDSETLSHFEFQSVSDQEIYYNMPAIVSGALACIQPEKCGIWASPYPRRYNNRLLNFTDEEKEAMRIAAADGEETAFNMVTAMLGNMYLSGRIELADELNFNLISEAVSLYKEIRPQIINSHPIWFGDFFHLNDQGIFYMGLESNDERCLLLSVWRIEGENSECVISLGEKYQTSRIAEIYPSLLETDAILESGKLHIRMNKDKMARFFVVQKV